MITLTFGKHNGKSVGLLLLKEPGYVIWLLSQSNPQGAMKSAISEAKRLILRFDAKPFVTSCSATNCAKVATYGTVYGNNVSLAYWWCEECDPYHSGANPGKLANIATYSSALQHVDMYCSASSADYKRIIATMANGKGLPARVGEKQIAAFFA
jgi:hypothetical protein